MTKFINLGNLLIRKKLISKIILVSDVWKWETFKHEGLAPENDYKYRFNITFEHGFEKRKGLFRRKYYVPNLTASVYLKTKNEAKAVRAKVIKLCEESK